MAYLQANVLSAYVFLAPAIVAGVVTLGVMQQIIRAFGRVEGSMQYLLKSWPTIIELASVYKRLREFESQIIEKELIGSKTDPRVDQILKLAIMAVGGQGGGVLANWIDKLCRAQGYACQATSVAGVAQRTGATIYYIEMAPIGEGQPVFSLAPAAGDVDILIASEMMEVGRAIMRGFVTPDRTTLIGSTHRALAVSEKTVPGDGIAASSEVFAAAEIAAKKLILMDMDEIAVRAKSVVSASLFGALAASKALPFPVEAFEESIRSSGKGVDASIRAFNDAIFAVDQPSLITKENNDKDKNNFQIMGPKSLLLEWKNLINDIDNMPQEIQEMACLLYTSPSPRDATLSRMPSSA